MLTRNELADNFAASMEKERLARGWSQHKMADYMQMSFSNYKAIASGQTRKIDLYTAYLLYRLTGKYAFQLVQDETFADSQAIVSQICALDKEELKFLKDFLTFLERMRNGNA